MVCRYPIVHKSVMIFYLAVAFYVLFVLRRIKGGEFMAYHSGTHCVALVQRAHDRSPCSTTHRSGSGMMVLPNMGNSTVLLFTGPTATTTVKIRFTTGKYVGDEDGPGEEGETCRRKTPVDRFHAPGTQP